MTRPELLEEAGRLLYGDRWQRQLARALDVNERTVRNWVEERTPVPLTRLREVLELLAAREKEFSPTCARISDFLEREFSSAEN